MTGSVTAAVIFYYFAVYIVFGALCSYIGGEKNRSRGNWFLAGFFLGIFGLIAVACVPAVPALKEKEKVYIEIEDDEELRVWKEKMGRK